MGSWPKFHQRVAPCGALDVTRRTLPETAFGVSTALCRRVIFSSTVPSAVLPCHLVARRLDIVTSARVSCACVWHPARMANRMEPSLGVQHGHIRRSPPHDADARADGSDVALVSKALIHRSTVCSICDQAFAPALVACYRRGDRQDLESSNRVGHVVGLRIRHAPAMIMLSNTQQMRSTQRRRRTGQPA
ncbi:MAG: hypothetical protein QOK18_3300 [Mycobacterium sp.]|jgi:hypothetical protein|nr:hypothetical protein [Mycobacterium sp.]MDT7757026.1 hypothetical protein [Mycobacterium sp.]